MATLSPLQEKIAEVLGLAEAAEDSTRMVSKLVQDAELRQAVDRMHAEAGQTRERTAGALHEIGNKAAIEERAHATKAEAQAMMRTYLGGEDIDGLDGFEYLVMSEAGELGHWEVVREMNQELPSDPIRKLTEFALPLQQRHFEDARKGTLRLAREEAAAAAR
jgi:hypothetical protein